MLCSHILKSLKSRKKMLHQSQQLLLRFLQHENQVYAPRILPQNKPITIWNQ
jgi:hypothetical protein